MVEPNSIETAVSDEIAMSDSVLGSLTLTPQETPAAAVLRRRISLTGVPDETRARMRKAADWALGVLDDVVVPVAAVSRAEEDLIVDSHVPPGTLLATWLKEGKVLPLPAALRGGRG